MFIRHFRILSHQAELYCVMAWNKAPVSTLMLQTRGLSAQRDAGVYSKHVFWIHVGRNDDGLEHKSLFVLLQH